MAVFSVIASGQAGWWKSNSTPGFDVELVKTKDFKFQSARIFYYVLRTKGFPAHAVVAGILRDLASGNNVLPLGRFQIDDKGRVLESDGTEYNLILGSISPGETYQLGLGVPGKNMADFAQVTPIPIETRNGQCHVWAILVAPYGTAYEVHGEGFRPGEQVAFFASSDGEVHNGRFPTHDDGTWWTIVLPGVKGKLSGTVQMTFTGNTCKVTIDAPWQAPPGIKKQASASPQ
ncbi:MAG: hypothetical protein ACYDDI_02110 [Candidatus Acidiferrales bacterium]